MSDTILEQFYKKPFIQLPSVDQTSVTLKKSMEAFMAESFEYKAQFSQSNYDYGFDGYSYPGQLDSNNQAYDDHLHSMVISEFSDGFPVEFEEYLSVEFPVLKSQIKKALQLDSIEKQLGLENQLGFSISVNYYPSYEESKKPEGLRLTPHTDGSLITIFPYGMDEGLEFEKGGVWKTWEKTTCALCFPGYMTELVTESRIKALNHRLNWGSKSQQDRFAFAVFIVPKPGAKLKFSSGLELNEKQYFEKYLSLFD